MLLAGMAPQIVSPLQSTDYILRQSDSAFTNLPLIANTDTDVKEIYWFIENRFIGRAAPDEKVFYPLTPGRFQVSVVDDHGRSHSRWLRIVYSD
jgi:penicillin-binding protein 1C